MKNCTRFFTQEQIDEIRLRLATIFGAKDSLFDLATYVGDDDYVAIVQNGKNKRANINQIREKVFEFDSTPTEGSNKPVTSNGIYEALLDIIGQITPGVSKYIYMQSDSEMFGCLISGPGGIYSADDYNQYCEQIFNALNNNYFIIIDDAICLTSYQENPNFFRLISISNTKYVLISAHKTSENTWSKLLGYVDTSLFLVDTRYLRLNGYTTVSNVSDMLSNYVTIRNLQNMIESYPEQGSTKLVTSGGVWQAIQNAITDIFTKDEVLTITDDMMELLMTGASNPLTDDCCNTIFNACENRMLIVYKDGICRYEFQETDSLKTFSLSVITTTTLHLMSTFFDKNILEAQWVVRLHSLRDNHILQSSEFTNTLLSYYTKALIDALLATINGYILSNRTAISDHYREYLTRMESTPKYHNGDWLTDEVDALGRVTSESTIPGVTPMDRFGSLWWAVKRNRLITYYGISDIYRESNITGEDPADDRVTTIMVKFLINELVTTFTVLKAYDDQDNLYLLVTRLEMSLDRNPSRIGKSLSDKDNLTILGSSIARLQVNVSSKLDNYSSFQDIGGDIENVPLIIDNGAYDPLLGDLKVISSNGLVTDKTDYINLCSLFGTPSIVLYGNITSSVTCYLGSILFYMNDDDNVVIQFIETESSIIHELVLNSTTNNSDIVNFLNSIFRKCNVIKNTSYLGLLLEALQCTVEFTRVSTDSNCFVRNNNSYQLTSIRNLPEVEIAEI